MPAAITVDTELTPKQQRFIEEYLVDFNGTAAARRSGYLGTSRGLRIRACRLLAQGNVRQAIEKAFRERQERTQISGDAELLHAQRMSRNPDLPPSIRQKYHSDVLRYTVPAPALRLEIETREELRISVDINAAIEEYPEVVDGTAVIHEVARHARRLGNRNGKAARAEPDDD